LAINPNKIPSKRKPIPLLPVATYPGYLAQVIDCGLHSNVYKGEDKGPTRKIMFTYEFADEFLKDEDGQDMTDKPRWLSEEVWLYPLKSERATSTARYKALDPNGVHSGDFVACLSTPINISVGHRKGGGKWEGRVFEEILGISGMRPKDLAKMTGMVNKPKWFDTEEPDVEVFLSLPTYVQGLIKANLEYTGSKLESLLKDVKTPEPAKKSEEQPLADALDDEQPY
jgi:hypothetical protein